MVVPTVKATTSALDFNAKLLNILNYGAVVGLRGQANDGRCTGDFLRRSIAVLLLSAASLASPAHGAVLSDQLCIPENDGTSLASRPTDAELTTAAQQIEQLIDSDRLNGDAALSSLTVNGNGANANGPEAIARYCSAAGEVMRIAPEGSQRQAQLYLETALAQSRRASLPKLTALTAYRLGVVAVSGASVSGLRGGEPVRRNGGRTAARLRAAEASESNAGGICSALGDFDPSDNADPSLSMLALDCAARLALESGSPDVSALATLRFARFSLDWANSSDDPQALLDVARDRALAAIQVASRIAEPRLRAELMTRLARTALELEPRSSAQLRDFASIVRQAGSNSDDAAEAGYEIAARVALAEGNRQSARPLIEQAILLESARPVPVMLPELLLLLADAEPERRQVHVATAYAALENVRPRLPRLDPLTEESMFTLHMRRVFEAAADAQLVGADGAGSTERIRTTQKIVEAFREAELQSAVGSECLLSRTSIDLAGLAPGEAILYPLLFDDRVELVFAEAAADGGRPEFRRLTPDRSLNRAAVAKLVDTLTVELTGGEGDGWKAPSRALYDLLIKPIESRLSPGTTLAIIPDGPLRGVPFASLLASDGKFLVERTAVSVAPALAYSQPGERERQDHLNIVAASLAKRVALPAGTFAALKGTLNEAKIAASNGSPGRLVPDFTRADLISAMRAGDVDILHLATHAAFNGRSDRAFIVANGEVIRLSELRRLLEENGKRGDMLDLLVLSACETAVGDDEASMGLAGAAVQAGAMSAIASLWQVDDAGTSELMKQFYENLRGGKSRSEALRDAQLAMIAQGGAKADPFIWSAFTLLGAWR
jgi:CHAT domain-containing protein